MNEKEDCSRLGCFCSCWVVDGRSTRGSKNDKSKKAVTLFGNFPASMIRQYQL